MAPMVEPAHTRHAAFAWVQIDGRRWRVFSARGAEHDVSVHVGEAVDARSAILRAVLRAMLWPLAAALPLLALALWWGVRQGLAPLQRLGGALAARQPQALDPVSVAGAPAEMRPMVDALNGLFGRIALLIDGERRFTADAAHELRTPIAAIRAQAQVALGATDDAERRHALRATLAGCDRATHLVEQLLALARVESVGATAGQPPELGALARQVLAELVPDAAARGQDIELDAPHAVRIAGNEALLAVLLRNLVDNASRYAGSGARLRVSVAADPPALTVEDSGPGLGDADRARLGERFFRGPGSSGSGLGWSIVQRIAGLHRIGVDIDRSPDLGGLRVRLSFAAG
jgi:two-component system, OmpR family, sensor histidine kinase QseC